MPTCALRSASLLVLAAFLTGCVTEPGESASASRSEESGQRTESRVASRSETSRETADSNRERASTGSTDRRSSEPAARSESRVAPTTDQAKLIEQLNEATRELAAMRAANAKLRAEQGRSGAAVAAEPSGVRADASDEKVAATLKSYTQFKKEMTTLVAELERLRKENGDRSGDYRDAAEQVRQAKATVTRLESDLRTEKKLRTEAEQNVTQLREQLRAVARAVSAAGGDIDKRK